MHGGVRGRRRKPPPTRSPDKAVLAVKKDSITEKQFEELKGLKQPSTEESLIRVEKKEDQIVVTAKGSGGHSAFPEGSTNAIQVLAFDLCGYCAAIKGEPCRADI